MPQLSTLQDFRNAQRLRFCYLCCQPLRTDQSQNRDHIPPRTIFLKPDRNPALWLPTHKACNSAQSQQDDNIGQLFGLLHGKRPSNPNHRRLKINSDLGAVGEIDIEGIVFRWVRGFHAALYQEPLDVPVRGEITTPFIRVSTTFGTPTPLKNTHISIVHTIKMNRAAGRLDTIQSSSDKFKYHCVWGKSADGVWCCMFAMDLYDWKDLGHSQHGPARGCCGLYYLPNRQLPRNAAIATPVVVSVSNVDELDPFGA